MVLYSYLHKSLIFYGDFPCRSKKRERAMQGGAPTRGLNGVITPINGIRYNWVWSGFRSLIKGVN